MNSARPNRAFGISLFIAIVAGAVLAALFVNGISTAQRGRTTVQITPPTQQVTTPPVATQKSAPAVASQPVELATRATREVQTSEPKQEQTSSLSPRTPSPDLITSGTYPFTFSTGATLEDM